ncbi:hypothetical protein LCGC14_3086780 [marine sediment metagenome]|uniref:Uncharacterized protein n=1 Tax=marine sediment metagenome TaxID=412755 RepID=A0A0F8X0A9_9ZZZZ
MSSRIRITDLGVNTNLAAIAGISYLGHWTMHDWKGNVSIRPLVNMWINILKLDLRIIRDERRCA